MFSLFILIRFRRTSFKNKIHYIQRLVTNLYYQTPTGNSFIFYIYDTGITEWLEDQMKVQSCRGLAWELSTVAAAFVHVLEDLGLVDALGLLEPEPSAAAAFLQPSAFTAVDVCARGQGQRRRRRATQGIHLLLQYCFTQIWILLYIF